jgi:hypothetical protein
MRHPMTETQLMRSLKSLGRIYPEIDAVYLFGSQAEGKPGPLSDVDIGVLFDANRVRPKDLFRARLNLITQAMEACRRSDVDVVLLNEASPLLAYEVVSGGKLAYERNHQRRVAYEVDALLRYLDFQPFLRTARRYLKRRLREGTYGG